MHDLIEEEIALTITENITVIWSFLHVSGLSAVQMLGKVEEKQDSKIGGFDASTRIMEEGED